ncbi:hypothetical protein, partial [Salmonella sp. s51228]|uniref:hypothetical protein n=1 Tax=Salmonella sp. s51228 TaxID=3159652 RepID=UPI00398056D3
LLYVRDTTPPILQTFDLDLNEGQISFRFTESVNASSLNVKGFTLNDFFSPSSTNYSLNGT